MILRRFAKAIKCQDWALITIEFVLVVSGVIVALQFYNWNSNRILKNQEREILEAFVEDLESNIESFDKNIRFDRASITSCDRVLVDLEEAREWDNDLALAMGHCRGWTSPYLNSFAYQNLKAEGVDLISNRQQRREISELCESEYENLIGDTDRTFWEFQHVVMLPAINNFLIIPPHGEDLGWSTRPMYPREYESLRQSREFQSVILIKRSHQTLSIKGQSDARRVTSGVLKSIRAELNLDGDER